jgi:hypothetical protein
MLDTTQPAVDALLSGFVAAYPDEAAEALERCLPG